MPEEAKGVNQDPKGGWDGAWRGEVQTTNCNTSIKGSDRKLVEIARHEGGAAGLTEIGRMSFEY